MDWQGVSDSIFAICAYKKIQFLTKIYFHYKSSRELYSDPIGANPAEAELKILTLFKDNIIKRGYTPCILELARYKTCEGIVSMVKKEISCDNVMRSPDLSYVDKFYVKYCKYAQEVENDLAHDMISYAIMEKCTWPFSYILHRSLGTTADDAIILSLLFQLIHAMYVINTVYPGFRHRDLHTHNVMLKIDINFKFDPINPQVILLQAQGKKFYVPFFGMYVKIIDFGFSILPEEGIVSNMYHEKTKDIVRSNHDMSLFFYWLDRIASSDYVSDVVKTYIEDILNRLDPHGIYYNYDVHYINSHIESAPTHTELINNPIFSGYLDKGKAVIYKQYVACD
jgi:serine/threonine protein kinase